MLYSTIRDEQPISDCWLPLGGDSSGAPTGVYGSTGTGQCGGEYRGVCVVYWEGDVTIISEEILFSKTITILSEYQYFYHQYALRILTMAQYKHLLIGVL